MCSHGNEKKIYRKFNQDIVDQTTFSLYNVNGNLKTQDIIVFNWHPSCIT